MLEGTEILSLTQHEPATSGITPSGDFWLFCTCGWTTVQTHYSASGLTALVRFAGDAFQQHKEAEAMADLSAEHKGDAE